MSGLPVYRHYKGGMYEVVALAKDSETQEMMVVYRSLKDQGVWVRPASMFHGMVEVPERRMVPRFERIWGFKGEG